MSTQDPSHVVLVTGAARRVGAHIARTLHAAGCAVAIHYRNSAGEANALVEALNAERSDSAAAFSADLLDLSALNGLVDAVVAHFGGLSGLVNNASSFYPTPMGSITAVDWADLLGSNFQAPLFLSQAAAPHLRAVRGAIVNIVDIHADRPLARYPVYSAAKAGLQGLTRALAIELAPEVRVNGVSPGPIQWPDDGQFSPQERETILRNVLLKREGSPSDIASAVRYLLLDAPYVTGQILAVDGGRSAHLSHT
jgi:pteridine reductase